MRGRSSRTYPARPHGGRGVFHDEANYHFELGKGEQITEGDDIAIVATGLMVNEARIAAEQLAAEGIHARVINIHTIKPLDEDIILKAAKECGKIVTAEEHSVIGERRGLPHRQRGR